MVSYVFITLYLYENGHAHFSRLQLATPPNVFGSQTSRTQKFETMLKISNSRFSAGAHKCSSHKKNS